MNIKFYKRLKEFFLISMLIFLSFCFGCTSIPSLPSENARLSIRRIAIVPAKTIPKANFNTFAKSRLSGAGKGLLIGLGAVVASPIVGAAYGSIAPGGGTIIGAFLGATVAALYLPISPVVGAIKAVPAGESEKTQRLIQDILIKLKAQENLADHMLNASLDNISNYWFEIVRYQDAGQNNIRLNDSLRLQGFDTLLELSIDEIGFDGGEGRHPTLAFFMNGNYRLVNTENNTEIYAGQLYYKSTAYELEEWAAEDSTLLQSKFDEGYAKLASEILENGFLLFDVHSSNNYCVLKPIYPILDFGFFEIKPKVIKVNSLQPVLSWEVFPSKNDKQKYGDQIKDVTYDLKIWSELAGSTGALIYEKIGIPNPYHKVDIFLNPFSDYFWTVRARFTLNDHKRMTNWAYSRRPGDISCLEKSIPNDNYFRFCTP